MTARGVPREVITSLRLVCCSRRFWFFAFLIVFKACTKASARFSPGSRILMARFCSRLSRLRPGKFMTLLLKGSCACRVLGILRGLNFLGARSICLYRELVSLGPPTPSSRLSCATVRMPVQPSWATPIFVTAPETTCSILT